MKYIVDVPGELPSFGALAKAEPLITCKDCRWRGKVDKMGLGSCYWDKREIYPDDYYCKMATARRDEE